MHEQARAINLGGHVGELELDGLKFRYRFTELFSLFGVVQCCFIRALRHADGECSDADAAAIEDLQRVNESLSRFPKQVVFW